MGDDLLVWNDFLNVSLSPLSFPPPLISVPSSLLTCLVEKEEVEGPNAAVLREWVAAVVRNVAALSEKWDQFQPTFLPDKQKNL